MKRFASFLGIVFLSVGCGRPATQSGQEVQFLVHINGIIDKAMIDGRLPAVVLDTKHAQEYPVAVVEHADTRIEKAPRAGTWTKYVFSVTIGKSNRFSDAAILVEQPLPVKGTFRIMNYKEIAPLTISSTDQGKGGGAYYRLFVGIVEPQWTGSQENKAAGDPNDPFEKKAP